MDKCAAIAASAPQPFCPRAIRANAPQPLCRLAMRRVRGGRGPLVVALAAALSPVLLLAGCIGGTGVAIGSNGDVTLIPLSELIGGQLSRAECAAEAEPSDAVLKAMFDNLNAYRVAQGLPRLRYSANLEKAAVAQAKDMYERDFFDHINPDGDGPFERARANGYCTAGVGENIGIGTSADPDEIQLLWQQSPGHDANMRDTRWTYVGMGHYAIPYDPHDPPPAGADEGSVAATLAGHPAIILHYGGHSWVQVFGQ